MDLGTNSAYSACDSTLSAPMTKSLFSNLFGDPVSRAEAAEKEGRKADALRLYAKGGDHRQAAKIAVDLRNVPAAVEHTLRTLFGRIPEG